MRKRGALTRRQLLDHTIAGRERALAAEDPKSKRAKEIEGELKAYRAQLAKLPSEEGPCDDSPRP